MIIPIAIPYIQCIQPYYIFYVEIFMSYMELSKCDIRIIFVCPSCWFFKVMLLVSI